MNVSKLKWVVAVTLAGILSSMPAKAEIRAQHGKWLESHLWWLR